MKRWVLTIATVLLVAVWLAAGPLRAGFTVSSNPGIDLGLVCGCAAVKFNGGRNVHRRWILCPGPTQGPGYRLLWLPRYERWWAAGGPVERAVLLPLWIPAALTGTLVAFAWRKRRRRKDGACPRCGYDLSGLPTGNGTTPPTCPECGT